MVRQLSSIEIQFLRAISEGYHTPAEIAKRLNVSSREVQQIANLLELENFIRIQLGSNIFEPSENLLASPKGKLHSRRAGFDSFHARSRCSSPIRPSKGDCSSAL